MNTNYLNYKTSKLMLSALLLLVCASVTVWAQPSRQSDKIAPDVRERIRRARTRTEPMQVLLQLKGKLSAELTELMEGKESRGKKLLPNLDTYVLEIPADKVAQLATFTEVDYVSNDNQFRPLGHLTTTTGVDLISATSRKGSNADLVNGAGIGHDDTPQLHSCPQRRG